MGKTLTRRDRRSLTCALAAKLQTPVQDCSRKTRRALSIATAAFRILALERPLGKGCSSARHARECTQLRNKIGLWAKGNDFAFSVRIDDLAIAAITCASAPVRLPNDLGRGIGPNGTQVAGALGGRDYQPCGRPGKHAPNMPQAGTETLMGAKERQPVATAA
jgi:hypothetical protein